METRDVLKRLADAADAVCRTVQGFDSEDEALLHALEDAKGEARTHLATLDLPVVAHACADCAGVFGLELTRSKYKPEYCSACAFRHPTPIGGAS